MEMKAIVFFSLMLILIASGCMSSEKSGSPDAVVQKAEAIDSGIKVPVNLMECPTKYFEKEGGTYKINCNQETREKVCSYYKTVKDGTEKTHNLEYNTECGACRFYGETGTKESGNTKYVHLGYVKGPCEQGMYKQ